MAWYKLYVVEMVNKKYLGPNDGKKLIKFGITHHMDIMKRFNPEVDDGYERNYDDWIILPKYSQVRSCVNSRIRRILRLSGRVLCRVRRCICLHCCITCGISRGIRYCTIGCGILCRVAYRCIRSNICSIITRSGIAGGISLNR